jgi:hypothetical protein
MLKSKTNAKAPNKSALLNDSGSVVALAPLRFGDALQDRDEQRLTGKVDVRRYE